MNKKFILVKAILILIFGLPILAKAEVFNFPGPVIVEENPLSIFSTTWADWRDGAEINGFRSQPGDPYNPLNEGDLLFLINAWGYQGEDFINSASISFRATENFSPEGTGTAIRFRTTENGETVPRESMRIDHNGYVGIGTRFPENNLEVVADVLEEETDLPARILITTYNDFNGRGSSIRGRRARGTMNEPSAVIAGDNIFALSSLGYGIEEWDKNGTFATASIQFEATEDFTDDHKGTAIRFATTSNETTERTFRMLVDHNGNVGIGTETPQSTLQVNGYVQLALTDGAPPAADCDEPSEYGRMLIDPYKSCMYICVADGWKPIKHKTKD